MSKKLMMMLAAVGFAFPAVADAQDVLNARFSKTLAGEMIVTGNAIGLSGVYNGTTKTGSNCAGPADGIGAFISMDQTLQDNVPVCNASGYSAFGKGTTNDWMENGSSAYLDLPSDAKVEHAELIWAASYQDKGGSVESSIASTCLLFTYYKEVNGTTKPITTYACGDSKTFRKVNEYINPNNTAQGKVSYYLNSSDMTRMFDKDNEDRTFGAGKYALEIIPAVQDHNTGGINGGGWTFAVVYSRDHDPNEQTRNITLFVGGAYIPEHSDKNYVVRGFCAPDTGKVNGKVFVSAMEGDARYDGDYLNIISGSSKTSLSGPNNPENNFFASQINTKLNANGEGVLDDRGSFGNKNHIAKSKTQTNGGRQGWDITTVLLPPNNKAITNKQTEAKVQLQSVNDSFMTTMVGFQIDVHAPSLTEKSLTVDGPLEVGRDFNIRLHMKNTGKVAAQSPTVTFNTKSLNGLTISKYSIDNGAPQNTSNAALSSSGIKIPSDIAEEGGECDIVLTAQIDPSASSRHFTLFAEMNYKYSSCNGGEVNTMISKSDALEIGFPVVSTVIAQKPLGGGEIEYTVTIKNAGDEPTSNLTLAVNHDQSKATYVSGSCKVNGQSVSNAESFFTSGGYLVNGGALGANQEIVITFVLKTQGAAEFDVSATSDPDGPGSLPGHTATIHTSVGNCGNGVRNSDEECDDGNNNNGDGCSSACKVEPGSACVQPAQDQAPCLSDPANSTTGCKPESGDPDVCGKDSDGDTIPDDYERDILHLDPNNPDSDGDGIIDGIEYNTGTNPTNPDSDGDTLCDGNKTVRNGDSTICIGGEDKNVNGKVDTGETDPRKWDTDNGSVDDGTEVKRGTDPLDPSDDVGSGDSVDSDCDTIPDEVEVKIGTNPNSADSDGDGLCDGNDIVSQCNGERLSNPCDGTEGQYGTDPKKADTDGDGIKDGTEIKGPSVTDPINPDTDGDGLCDGSKTVVDEQNQVICLGGEDMNNNGKFDAPDPNTPNNSAESDPTKYDTDGGGASDGEEFACMSNRNDSSDDSQCKNGGSKDSDGDTIPDDVERQNGTDPNKADTDGDGLCDGNVVVGDCIGSEGEFGTDPLKDDTDEDGLKDGVEAIFKNELNENKTDPLDADSDGDGLCDGGNTVMRPANKYAVEANCQAGEDKNNDGFRQATETSPGNPDTDAGGVTDGQEVIFDGTNPLDPSDDIKNGNQDNVSESEDPRVANEFIEDDCSCQSVLSDSHSRFPVLAALMAMLGAAFLGLRRRKDSHKA